MRTMSRLGAVGLLVSALACTAPRESDRLLPSIAELARQNVKLQAEVDALTGSLRHLSQPSGTPVRIEHDQRTIAAHVLEAKRSFDLVVLDRGRRDGVAVGLVFEVRDGSKHKGEVYVAAVQRGTCSALILREWSPIGRGDGATSDTKQCSVPLHDASSAQQVAEFERVNAELRERIGSLTTELGTVMRRPWRGVIVDAVPPKIDASVVEVKRADSVVAFDKGSHDGVKVGFVFDVYLGPTYRGMVRVTEVKETTCSGVILSERSTIMPGDAATTGL